MRRILAVIGATLVYYVSLALIKVITLCVLRMEVQGLSNIPRKGAVMLASKHSREMDILVLGVLTGRWIHFVAKKELYEIWGLGPWMKVVQAIPIDRDKIDRTALEQVAAALERGGVIGLFPEGTRMNSPLEIGETHHLFGLMATKGAPCCVVPIGIVYDDHFFPWKVRVVCGEPIAVQPDTKPKALADTVHSKMVVALNAAIEALNE